MLNMSENGMYLGIIGRCNLIGIISDIFNCTTEGRFLLTFASLRAEVVNAQLVPRGYARMLPNYQPDSQAPPIA